MPHEKRFRRLRLYPGLYVASPRKGLEQTAAAQSKEYGACSVTSLQPPFNCGGSVQAESAIAWKGLQPPFKEERGYLSVTPLRQPLVQCFLDTPRTIGTVFLFLVFFQSGNYRWRQCDVETLKALFFNTTARASTKFTHSIHLQHHYISVCQCTTKSELFGGYKWHKSP